ncbi:MAG TPA: cytochrome c3 family protein, partial [Kofleriaceae bacterium]
MRGKIACAIAGAFALLLVLLVPSSHRAYAQDFFSSSPGALTSSHAELDNQQHCSDCHINNTNEISDAKCLGCHDHQDLGARIAAGKGFHASPAVKGKNCKTCHAEHKGKSFDVMGWKSQQGGEKNFNHELTGWKLNGKHAVTEC